MNGGSCIDDVNSYQCSCSAGYYGYNCKESKFGVSLNNVTDREYLNRSGQIIYSNIYLFIIMLFSNTIAHGIAAYYITVLLRD